MYIYIYMYIYICIYIYGKNVISETIIHYCLGTSSMSQPGGSLVEFQRHVTRDKLLRSSISGIFRDPQ